MAGADRELRVVISGDATSLKRAFGTIDRTSQTTGQKVRGAFKNVAPLIGGALVGALGYAAKAASDLNETISFTEVTFKGATDQMLAWGETTLDTLGLSRQSALDAASGFGGLFQTTGATAEESAKLSQQMVQLAVDMSSAKNVGLEDSLAALKSGLIGEAEPMRRFNVLLSEAEIKAYAYKNGLAAAGTELSEAVKVQARMGVVLKQTKDLQGDYARTADSSANAQRRAAEAGEELAAAYGEAIAPAVASAATALTDYFKLMTEAGKAGDRHQDSLEASKNLMTQMAIGVQAGTVTMERYQSTLEALTLAEKDWWNAGGILHDRGADMLTDHQEELNRKLQDGIPIVKEATEAQKKLGDATGKAAKAARSFAGMEGDALDQWAAGTVDNFNTVEDALDGLADKHNVTAAKIRDAMQKALTNQIEFGDNWKAVVNRAGDDADTLLSYIQENFGAEAPAIVAALADANRREFDDIVGIWNRSRSHASRMAGGVGGSFDKVKRDAESAKRGVDSLGDSINNLPDNKVVSVQVRQQVSSTGSGKVPLRAHGGNVAAGETYLVGERGPELFTAPRPGRIEPNHRVGGGGDTYNITVNAGSLADERKIAAAIQQALEGDRRRNARHDRTRGG